jgi:hypothetical protein
MNTVLLKFVTVGIRVWIITITIYVKFREPNGTLICTGFYYFYSIFVSMGHSWLCKLSVEQCYRYSA